MVWCRHLRDTRIMSRTSNPFRQALLTRTLTLGSWIQIGHPASAELLSGAGCDWVAIDCEHTDIGIESFGRTIRGMRGACVPVARVRENDRLAIRQVLDLGARGVIVPLINSAAAAEDAVQSAKYPPRGQRGYAFCLANQHGQQFDTYVNAANADIAVVVMIESRAGVEQIDAILAVDGVDGAFVGPYDLSGSLGVPGKVDDPAVQAACARVAAAGREHGKAVGLHVVRPSPDAIRRAREAGFSFLALGMDTVFIDEGVRQALRTARDS